MIDKVIDDMTDGAIAILHSIWNSIKHFLVTVLNFFENIVDWFKDPLRLIKLKKNENLMAVSIKENLDSGSYNVVNCLFNNETNEVDEYYNSKAFVAENIDLETAKQFGKKAMIILS